MAQLREIRIQSTGSAPTRTETFLGRTYTVFPVTMLVEGVLQGANSPQPEYVPPEVYELFPDSWNGRPLVMNHPQVNGVYVSANAPDVLADWQFGFVFNTKIKDRKLVAEAWVDNARAEELGGDAARALTRLNAGEVVEVSTGLFVETINKSGRWNTESYNVVWDRIVPDHLAILSEDLVGACSIADGCGANRVNSAPKVNEAALRTYSGGHEDCGCGCGGTGTCGGTQQNKVVTMKVGDKDFSIQEWLGGVVNSLGFKLVTNEGGGVGEAVQIPEPTEDQVQALQAAWNKAVEEQLIMWQDPEAPDGIKVHQIDASITLTDTLTLLSMALRANFPEDYVYLYTATTDKVVYQRSSGYVWDDSNLFQQSYSVSANGDVTFSGEPEPVLLLTRIVPKTTRTVEALSTNSGNSNEVDVMAGESNQTTDPQAQGQGGAESTAATSGAPAVNGGSAASAVASPSVQTTEQFLAAAPPEVRRELERAMSRSKAAKEAAISTIKANAANKFSDAQLGEMDLDVLEGMVALMGQGQGQGQGQEQEVRDFSGRAAPAVNSQTQGQGQGQPHVQEGLMPAPRVFAGKVKSRWSEASYDLGEVSPAGNG